MKFHILFVVAAVFAAAEAFTEAQQKQLDELNQECVKESGLDQKTLRIATEQKIYNDDPKLKLQIFCLSKKAGLQNEKGDLQPAGVKARLLEQMKDEAAVDSLMNKCVVQKDTREETAFNALTCFHKNLPADATIFKK